MVPAAAGQLPEWGPRWEGRLGSGRSQARVLGFSTSKAFRTVSCDNSSFKALVLYLVTTWNPPQPTLKRAQRSFSARPQQYSVICPRPLGQSLTLLDGIVSNTGTTAHHTPDHPEVDRSV